jgi:hypothetical protein
MRSAALRGKIISKLGAIPERARSLHERRAAAVSPDDHSLQDEQSLGVVMNHREWLAADAARLRHEQQWSALFREFYVVLYPTSVPAFPHDVAP